MAVFESTPKRARNVRILAAGGTISMTEAPEGGGSATPDLDGAALLASIPGLEGNGVEASTITNLPSAHLSVDDQLRICREARERIRTHKRAAKPAPRQAKPGTRVAARGG